MTWNGRGRVVYFIFNANNFLLDFTNSVLNVHLKELMYLLVGETSQGRGSGERENRADSTYKRVSMPSVAKIK